MSLEDILRYPLLKVSRAEFHISDLCQKIQAYLDGKPLRLMTIGYPKLDQEIHFIKVDTPVPPEFSLIIGDAVHNLRSSLDLLIFAMIGEKAKRPESVQFPFSRSVKTLSETMNRREIRIAGQGVWTAIERLEPFPDGNKFLSGLHSLDIADKHKLIIPAAASARMTSVELARILPSLVGREGVDVTIHEGVKFICETKGSRELRRLNRHNIRSGEYERETQPRFQLIFEEGQAFSACEVTITLIALVEAVREALDRVARAFVA